MPGLADVERRQLYDECYYNQGGSVLVISRHNRRDQWEVALFHAKNRRIHGLSGLAINATRTDGFETVTSWGPSPHEQGDDNYLSVQHPGEDCDYQLTPLTLNRAIELLDLDGTTLFTQNRTVPRSSNWPSNIEGLLAGPPRPCVIAIQRKDSRYRFI